MANNAPICRHPQAQLQHSHQNHESHHLQWVVAGHDADGRHRDRVVLAAMLIQPALPNPRRLPCVGARGARDFC